ncbi:ORF6N domain-containing protein [Candidatus Methylomirabilis sp.]|uniref:ORF6N domain-containing protein n=1 Tax=Candidatus Methylomirabilis sp. TaxID=2032687 RepID=UPI003C76F05F
MSESGGSPGKDGGPAEDFYEPQRFLLKGHAIVLRLRDLTVLYGVPTKALKQAVKRNIGRFPKDFMFVLTPEEFTEWRSQFVTSKADRMGLRYPPMAFTEQGVAMLTSVLNSERAIQVHIEIMRVFVHLRRFIATNRNLARRLDRLEKKCNAQLKIVFDAIRQLMVLLEQALRNSGAPSDQGYPAIHTRRSDCGVQSIVYLTW